MHKSISIHPFIAMKKILLSLLLVCLVSILYAQPPHLVKDIWVGKGHSVPQLFTAFKGKLYFFANDSTHGLELWSHDLAGTFTLVHDLNPNKPNGALGMSDRTMPVLNNKMYFTGNNGSSGRELFVYDGVNPPSLVADLWPGTTGSTPVDLYVMENKLYFSAQSPTIGSELFVYDGVNPPTGIDIIPGTTSSAPAYLIAFNGKLYFSAYTASTGHELYAYDTSTGTASMVQDINPGVASSFPLTSALVLNSKLYFCATLAGYGNELYSYDGTTVTRLTDLSPAGGNGLITGVQLAAFGGKIYFSGATDSANYQLFRYDPVADTTTLVHTIYPGGNSLVRSFALYKNKLYFSATDAPSNEELWQTDGTTTNKLAEINALATVGSSPYTLYEWKSALYFSANDGNSGHEVFRIGTPVGIEAVSFDGSVRVYPNPATEKAIMELTLNKSQQLSITLVDAGGRMVWNSAANSYHAGTTQLPIPVHSLSAGIYFFMVRDIGGKLMVSGSLEKN
jgi:ELWxxDGT repeat protein